MCSDTPDWLPKPPANDNLLSDYLDAKHGVSYSIDRYQLRLNTDLYRCLTTLQLQSDFDSLTDVATLALWYARTQIQETYSLDWDAFEAWYLDQLMQTSEPYGMMDPALQVDLGSIRHEDFRVHVRPHPQHHQWHENLRRLTGLQHKSDGYRVCLCYALVNLNRDTYIDAQWSGWLRDARAVVHQLERVIEDRKQRYSGDVFNGT